MSARIASVLLACALACGCAKSLDELAPFPCADDGGCPEGFACVDDRCLTEALAADAIPYGCAADGSCAFADALGTQCVPEVGCTTRDAAIEAAPFACTALGGCPFGDALSCIADIGCATVEIARAEQPFACTNDVCPAFADARFECFRDVGCFEAGLCDPVDQSGCAEPEPKCAVVETVAGFAARCVEAIGDLATGDTCDAPTEIAGIDDCAAGEFCSAVNALAGERRCRAFCRESGGCAGDEVCSAHLGVAGLCVPACTIFETPSCPPGESCKTTGNTVDEGPYGVCNEDGPGADGDACTAFADCGENLVCNGEFCTPICNVEHPCAPGGTCFSSDRTLSICECNLFESFCPGGRICSPFGSDVDGYVNSCIFAGGIGTNGPCSFGEECASGVCFTDASGSFCRELCDASRPCVSGAACAFRPNESFGICPF